MDLRQKWHGVETRWWLVGGTVVGIGGLVLVKRWRAAKATNADSMRSLQSTPLPMQPGFTAPLPGGGGVGGGSGMPLPPFGDPGTSEPLPTAPLPASPPSYFPPGPMTPTSAPVAMNPPAATAGWSQPSPTVVTYTPPNTPTGGGRIEYSGPSVPPPNPNGSTTPTKIYKRGVGWVDA